MSQIIPNINLTEYESLTVTVDNKQPVECKVLTENGIIGVTDGTWSSDGTINGGTFEIYQLAFGVAVNFFDNQDHTISATGKKRNIKKLDSKYLDFADFSKIDSKLGTLASSEIYKPINARTYTAGYNHLYAELNDLQDIAEGLEAVNSVILHSTTSGSNKKFKITVDDTGKLTATEVVEQVSV